MLTSDEEMDDFDDDEQEQLDILEKQIESLDEVKEITMAEEEKRMPKKAKKRTADEFAEVGES